MSILEVNNVSKSFGGVKANVDISMSVKKGKIVISYRKGNIENGHITVFQ